MTEGLKTSQSIELNSLYQEVIVEHSRRPRFKAKSMPCRFCQEGKNPLCGDTITVFCQIAMDGKKPVFLLDLMAQDAQSARQVQVLCVTRFKM